MQQMLIELMAEAGMVKAEIDSKFFGQLKPSRGYYICEPSGRYYLHHDGLIKDGVRSDSENPAFWETEEDANKFFNEWKSNR